VNIKQIKTLLLSFAITLIFSTSSMAITVTGSGSTFEIVKGDGFDGADGAARETAFIAAAQYWADILVSPVTIVIDAEFTTSLFCDSNNATLGSAGASNSFLSSGATALGLQNNVWYPTALINAHNGSDRFPNNGDIRASFNANLGDSNCLGGLSWYYGLDGNAPSGTITFFDIVLHELGHGLGITSLINDDGSDFQGRVDIFTTFLHDQSTGKDWTAMNNTERSSSLTNTGSVVWSGDNVNALAGSLTAGVNSGKVRMYAPSTFNAGSSISHFDSAVTPNILMEPEYTKDTTSDHAIALLNDIGWSIFSISNNIPSISGHSSLTTNEDESITLTLSDLTVIDTDNNFPTDFTLTLNNGTNYSVSNQTITPSSNFSGILTVPVTVNDGLDNSPLHNVSISVSAVNDSPVISGSPSTLIQENLSYSFTPTATDVDLTDTKTFSIVNKPSWANFSTATGALTGTPTNSDVGTTSNIVITVTDSAEASDSLLAFSITVVNVNNTPTISGSPTTSIAQDTAYSFVPTVVDIDTADTKTFSIVNKPSWANFSTATGALTGTPTNSDVGTTSNIVITVTDSAGASDSLLAFSITVLNVNNAPEISGSPTTSIAQDTAYSFVPTVVDIDTADTKTFSIVNKPNWANFNTATGALTGTPTNSDVGTTSNIVITVTDSAGASDSLLAFSITVVNVNNTPTISGSPTTSINQNTAYSFVPTVVDIDTADTKTFSIVNKPSWANFSTATGALTGTPTNSEVGTTSNIVITVTDSAGASDSLLAFSITVLNVNNAPEISGSPTTSIAQNTAYSFVPTVVDIDTADTKTFSIVNKPSWANFNTATGALTGSPTDGDVGTTANIVITVTDSTGASDSLLAFNIEVQLVTNNQAPTIENQTYSINEDSELTITFSSEIVDDSNNENNDISEVTYSIVNVPVNGSLLHSNASTWIYTPNENFNGVDTFTYIATLEGVSSEPSSVNITILPVNDQPIAQDDVFILTLNESGRYALNVLDNDTDVDGDELNIINISSDIGTTSVEENQLIFQVSGAIDGNIALQYAVSDGNNSNSTAEVIISFDSNNNALLPTISLPEDITLNATGLFTKVDLGLATAINSQGNTIATSLIDNTTQFSPGSHAVYWQAIDITNNVQQIATQKVNIHPLINFTNNIQGNEGQSYQIEVVLNGESPTYPVNIPYSVAGTATSDDHDLSSGELIIESGLSGYIELTTFEDELVDPNETVIITLDNTLNLGSKTSFTLTIVESELAPKATINVFQNNEPRRLIDKTSGEVVITSKVNSMDISDQYNYIWESDTLNTVDTDTSQSTFTFDPSNIATGLHVVSLTIGNLNNTQLSTQVFAYFNVLETLTTLTGTDSDGDLIPDNIEGYQDSDSDGIPNYLDNNTYCNRQPETLTDNNSYVIEVEPGNCLLKGVNVANNISNALLLNTDELNSDNDAENTGGIFDFIVSDLSLAGESVNVVLPQRLSIPANAIYRKLNRNSEWVDFIVDEKNYYSSAQGEPGYCPPPNDNSWIRGLTLGHWCVQVTIEDGGLNDVDGVANHQIVDPSGVAILKSTNTRPNAQSDQINTVKNKAVTIDALANDTDENGDTLRIINTSVDFGTVTIINQEISFQPPINFIGLATIHYDITDENNGSGFAKIEVNIVENTAPVTVNDLATTDDSTAITIDVLLNDSDVNNDTLSLTTATAEQGSVRINDNTLIYTPQNGFSGTDTVIYTVTDNNGGESQGQVLITVEGSATAPTTTTTSTESDTSDEDGGGGLGVFLLLYLSALTMSRFKSKNKRFS